MPVNAIKALPVQNLAAANAHLYLWTINEHLEAACEVMQAWGFIRSATLVWCKPRYSNGLGGAWPSDVEFVLYGRLRGGAEMVDFTRRLRLRAAELGLSKRDVNTHMGTSDMAGWWLSDLSHRSEAPTVEQWQKLKMLLQVGPEWDEEVESLNAGAAVGRAPGRWFQWPRGKHSAKPEAFLDLVESVSPGPYLELFARRNRLGWDTWGNECLDHGVTL
jgi:hypothetical protein